MIPRGTLDTDLEIVEGIGTTRTYKVIDREFNVEGHTDELEALRQSLEKELNTERYEYLIYGFNYGIDLESLLGKDHLYVRAELKRRVDECIMKDDRVLSVENPVVKTKGDEISYTCDVISIYGNFSISRGVSI